MFFFASSFFHRFRCLFFSLLILSLLTPLSIEAKEKSDLKLITAKQKEASIKERNPFFYAFRQINTEHFQILYEPQDIEAARETAACCEEVYQKVTQLLDSYPPKITVYLHGRLDMANGSYYPVPESLNLYVTSPTDSFHGAKTENWIKGLLTHELTHYVHLSYEEGWLYKLSQFFGPSIKTIPGAFLPGWILEGYTTNTETLFTEGGRGRNPLFELYYKSHLIEGNLFSLKQAGYGHTIPFSGRIYVAGYIFINYLMKTYGENFLKELHKEIVNRTVFNPDEALFRLTGKRTQQLWDEMRQDLMKKYRFTQAIKEGIPLSPYQEGHFYQPLPSQKGWLLYSKEAQKSAHFSFWDPKSNQFQFITKALLTDDRSFSIDQSGNLLIFSSYDVDLGGSREAEYDSELFYIDFRAKEPFSPYLKGKKWRNIHPKQLTRNQHLWHPALSGDGKRLVAIQKQGSYSRLVEVSLQTGETKPIIEIPFATLYNPVLNSDGTKILFTANLRGKQDIWLYEKGKAAPLTKMNSGSEYFASFASDHQILFSSDQEGSLNLYQIDLNTKKITLLLEDPIGVLSAQPYHDQWLYATYRSRGYSLFLSTDSQREISASTSTGKELFLFNEATPTATKPLSSPLLSIASNQTEFSSSFPLFTLSPEEQVEWGYPPVPDLPIIEDRFYPNLARLIGWTPLPFHYTERATKPCYPSDPLGIGFAIFAQSVDHTAFLQAIVTNPFQNFQPSLFIDSRFKLGRFQFEFSHKQQFGLDTKRIEGKEEEGYYQHLFNKWIITTPLYYHLLSKNVFGLNFQTGLAYELELRKKEPFFLFEASSSRFANFHLSQSLTQFNGINFYFSQLKAPAAIYPEAQFKTSLGIQIRIPLTPEEKTILLGSWDTGFSIPLIPQHNLFSSLSLGYSNDVKYSARITPRGFEPLSVKSLGRGVATFGYNYQFSKTDLPLYSNLSFHGLALALFLQTQFFYSLSENNPFADPLLYTGIEFKPVIGWSQGTFPITIGVNVRFDPTFQRKWNQKNDIAWYFGFDSSFITSYQHKKGSFIPQPEHRSWKLQE